MSGVGRRSLLIAGGAGTLLAATPAGPASATGGAQSAFLNHSYTVLDAETAAAVAHNAYLRRFGAFQKRTTSNGETTYSGYYLLGRQTYLEMFPPAALPAPDDRAGASGLALSPDVAGAIGGIKRRMTALGADDPLDVVQTKEVDGEQIPWFRVVAPTTTYRAAFPWVMEYRRSYFADPRTHSEPGNGPDDVSRERYNPDTYRRRLMRDVVSVDLGAPSADLPAMATTLRAAGLRVTERRGEVCGAGRSERVTVRAVPRARAGWQEIGFRLNGAPGEVHAEPIGNSELEVGPGPTATWRFA